MIFTTYFSESGIPKTGLSPTITLRKVSDNSIVVDAQVMTEIGNGWYKYDYVSASNTEDYVGVSDSITLAGPERYAPIATSIQGNVASLQTDITFLKDIDSGKWEITENQMIFYKADGTTEVARFNLFDASGHPAMTEIYKREVVT